MNWPAHLSTSRVLVLNRLRFTPQSAEHIRKGSLLHLLTEVRQLPLRSTETLTGLNHLRAMGLADLESKGWVLTDAGVFAAVEYGPFGAMATEEKV